MISDRSKRRDFLMLAFISKSISKKLLINVFYIMNIRTHFVADDFNRTLIYYFNLI